MIEDSLFHSHLHKLPNADLILQLDQLWRPGSFLAKKVKSHRKFEDAGSLEELWYIAENYCADMVANLAFQLIRQRAGRAATFARDE